jgi:UDP:flavonoid glycosyltransferase YjiC (YdhE family)
VTSFGSAGDFLPTLAVASTLHRRGHDVRFVANPAYAAHAEAVGMAFVPAGTRLDVFALLERRPSYATDMRALFRDVARPNLIATWAATHAALSASPADVVVAGDPAFTALWAARERGVPSVLITASPVSWATRQTPVVLGDSVLATRCAVPLTLVAGIGMRAVTALAFRRLARDVGCTLPDVSLLATQRMAAANAGMWSPFLRGPVVGESPNRIVCGSARASTLGAPSGVMPADVATFLDGGPPPVVVAFGSAYALTAAPLQRTIAEACADAGLRCIVVGHRAGAAFPPDTLAVPWAPYDVLFPRAAAVVVHGGAGTTAEALRSGRPIVGMPFAFDQFTLCALAERLGAGVSVPRRRRGRAEIATMLRRVTADVFLARRAADVGERFAAEPDGADTAADVVERVALSRDRVPTPAASRRRSAS